MPRIVHEVRDLRRYSSEQDASCLRELFTALSGFKFTQGKSSSRKVSNLCLTSKESLNSLCRWPFRCIFPEPTYPWIVFHRCRWMSSSFPIHYKAFIRHPIPIWVLLWISWNLNPLISLATCNPERLRWEKPWPFRLYFWSEVGRISKPAEMQTHILSKPSSNEGLSFFGWFLHFDVRQNLYPCPFPKPFN